MSLVIMFWLTFNLFTYSLSFFKIEMGIRLMGVCVSKLKKGLNVNQL